MHKFFEIDLIPEKNILYILIIIIMVIASVVILFDYDVRTIKKQRTEPTEKSFVQLCVRSIGVIGKHAALSRQRRIPLVGVRVPYAPQKIGVHVPRLATETPNLSAAGSIPVTPASFILL